MTTLKLQSGYIIIDTSTAVGGITYTRKQIKQRKQGKGQVVTIHSVKRVDHKQLVRSSDAIVQAARYALRCRATNTQLGWFARGEQLDGIRHAFADLRIQATTINIRAERIGSKRRVRIGFVPLKLDISLPEALEEMQRTVTDLLTALLTTLRAGDVKGLPKLFLRTKNLDQLVARSHRDMIVFAIENARVARGELNKAKAGGRSLKLAGRHLNLADIEDCLELVAEAAA